VVSHELGHSSTQITQDLYTSVLPQVSKAAADAVAALLASSRRTVAASALDELAGRRAHTSHTRADITDTPTEGGMGITAGQTGWGGWGSNPRPKDYESSALTG
jgi:hypothetical protein